MASLTTWTTTSSKMAGITPAMRNKDEFYVANFNEFKKQTEQYDQITDTLNRPGPDPGHARLRGHRMGLRHRRQSCGRRRRRLCGHHHGAVRHRVAQWRHDPLESG